MARSRVQCYHLAALISIPIETRMAPVMCGHVRHVANVANMHGKRREVNRRIGALLCLLAIAVQFGLTALHSWHRDVGHLISTSESRQRWCLQQEGHAPAAVFTAHDLTEQAPSAPLLCPWCWVLSHTRNFAVTQSQVADIPTTAAVPVTLAVWGCAQSYRFALSPRAPPSAPFHVSVNIPPGVLV